MMVAEKIQEYVRQLSPPLQAEVLDFVEYLLSRVERDLARAESAEWSDVSLASAMRGMERENTPVYTLADVKARW
jgi:hypothetical protein